ncbi:hypothetical protein H4I95_03181 [Botrytis cinerea]
MNRHIDLAAILSLFRPDRLWKDMGCDRKTNPFRLEDGHPFAVLMANSFAVHRYLNTLPDKDQVKRGEWLGKIHDVFPLKRGFGTIIDGVSIGSAISPVKTSIIDLDIDEKEVNVMGVILAENKKASVYENENGIMIMDGRKFRSLIQSVTRRSFASLDSNQLNPQILSEESPRRNVCRS